MPISRPWLIACVYAVGVALAALLLIQHWVHIPDYLPYLVLLVCPLMHLFIHRGHGGHRGSSGGGGNRPDQHDDRR